MKTEDGILRLCWHFLKECCIVLNPWKRRERLIWLKKDGVVFAQSIGIRPGDRVIDFGSGPGNYSIPIARVVGSAGKVFSMERREKTLRRLMKNAQAEELHNIKGVGTIEQLQRALAGKPANVILFYDVLQFMEPKERTELYQLAGRLIATDGFLSVHPKHTVNDKPDRYFKCLTVEDVCCEIESAGFIRDELRPVTLWHGHGKTPGKIVGFRKRTLQEHAPNEPGENHKGKQ